MQIIGFHNPSEDYGFLSNWYLSDFQIDGITFTSMEQYMMHKKAVCFKDENIAKQILAEKNVSKIKELGRLVSGYDEHIWNGVRQIIIYEGLLAKFSQNEFLKGRLLDTKNSILAECAVKDRIWGIGLSLTDPKRLIPSEWKGQNLLGYALMMVRGRLKKGSYKIYNTNT
jgi:hypothetical protein